MKPTTLTQRFQAYRTTADARGYLSRTTPLDQTLDPMTIKARSEGYYDVCMATYSAVWSSQRTGEASLQTARSWHELLPQKVSDIDTEAVYAAVRALGSIKPATLNRKLSALSLVLRTAQKLGRVPKSWHMPDLPYRKEPEGRSHSLTPQEERALLEALEDTWAQCCFVILLETGVRCSELFRLTKADVSGGLAVLRQTKNGRPRSIPLSARALAVWESLPATFGEGYSYARFAVQWKRAKDKLGWNSRVEIVPHILRHTCASRLATAGVSLGVIQQWLGHTTIKSTARYVHNDAQALHRALALREAATGLI